MRRQFAILVSASLLAAVAATGLPGVAIAAPPPNDDFADAVVLVGLTAEVEGTNVDATGELGEPEHADAGGPIESVWYSWTAPVSSRFRIDTCVIDYNSTLAVYTGGSVSTVTLVGSNDDSGVAGCGFSGNTFGSIVEFDAVAGTTYRIAVDGQGSNEGTFTLRLEPTAGVGTLTVHKSICADVTEPTLTVATFTARAECVAGEAIFEVTVTDPDSGVETVVATVETDGGTATVELVAGDFDVTEILPALAGPLPITVAPDGAVSVVAENPQTLLVVFKADCTNVTAATVVEVDEATLLAAVESDACEPGAATFVLTGDTIEDLGFSTSAEGEGAGFFTVDLSATADDIGVSFELSETAPNAVGPVDIADVLIGDTVFVLATNPVAVTATPTPTPTPTPSPAPSAVQLPDTANVAGDSGSGMLVLIAVALLGAAGAWAATPITRRRR